jgi:hypothetical protein
MGEANKNAGDTLVTSPEPVQVGLIAPTERCNNLNAEGKHQFHDLQQALDKLGRSRLVFDRALSYAEVTAKQAHARVFYAPADDVRKWAVAALLYDANCRATSLTCNSSEALDYFGGVFPPDHVEYDGSSGIPIGITETGFMDRFMKEAVTSPDSGLRHQLAEDLEKQASKGLQRFGRLAMSYWLEGMSHAVTVRNDAYLNFAISTSECCVQPGFPRHFSHAQCPRFCYRCCRDPRSDDPAEHSKLNRRKWLCSQQRRMT